MIELSNICLSYGKNDILTNVSLSLRQQGLTSIIGPNGAGKSSLLAILNRLQKPTSGEVRIDGQPIDSFDNRVLATRLSILRQDNQINARISVRDLVCFGRFPYHNGRPTAEDWAVIDQAIHYLDMSDLQDRYLDQLSGGQRQRAFIAMVLAQDTQYVFLDEPLNNLDMKHSVAIMKQLRRACEELSKSIVVVLHDINFASCYSDEIVSMKHGRIAHSGSPEQVMQDHILMDLYDMPLSVQQIDDKRLCLYYL
ncbi:ABC transporter ATP-binding protein [Reinekea blandensis]|uniref:ABC transporter domain-containing protein n=1 Tax=Reinekea blandensis MED297 TaxID=314283 RepID=A4BFY3_9GAMM|nr:ATP-binding cassette domain-containing protein [Reinekea blandensis]EAR09001.1 hypothetical protein MED297_03892 [Reinekea sp. MED297] [Reinekea blandensis MED297]